MKRYLLLGATILILLAKYLQIFMQWVFIPSGNYIVALLITISSLFLLLLSIKALEKIWKITVIFLGILSIISILLWVLYTTAWLNLIWSFLIFTSLFLTFYSLSHYEIKKFPAFSYAFSIIYIITESISLWRGDSDALFFLIYLTIVVPMYIVGILRIKR